MTSPTPSTLPGNGKSDAGALSPGTKIFVASTTLLIGSAVAVACWKTSSEYDVNPVMDRQLVSAPLPGKPLPKAEDVSETEKSAREPVATEMPPLPSLAAAPAMDSGNVKYAQAYPPPIYVSDSVPKKETAKKETSEPAPKKFINVSAEFKRVHAPTPAPPKTARPKLDFSEKPQTVSVAEMSDALLPYFHATENLKPMEKTGNAGVEPRDPFQAPPTAAEPVEQETLTPLQPIRSVSEELTELKPRLKN